MNITNFQGATLAIDIVDSALSVLNTQRSALGALQSRFEKVMLTLQNAEVNMSNARARIQDADFAYETSIMTKNQILQQAGTAMLVQANQLPQLVLALLKG